ncbi:MAG TPA: hypothetical protein VFI31_09035 [Pirellulales bacterium]|nr:hypothetical protein [Pirellulales bacterium]
MNTDQDTGKTTIKEEGEHTETDDATGAKVETSVDKETTVKPADRDNGAPADGNEPAAPGANATDGTEPGADDNK